MAPSPCLCLPGLHPARAGGGAGFRGWTRHRSLGVQAAGREGCESPMCPTVLQDAWRSPSNQPGFCGRVGPDGGAPLRAWQGWATEPGAQGIQNPIPSGMEITFQMTSSPTAALLAVRPWGPGVQKYSCPQHPHRSFLGILKERAPCAEIRGKGRP